MLKRDISTFNVLVAAAGGMIGSGWLFSPYISAQIAGGNALMSWLIATLFMLFIALPLCELGAMLPLSGGMANYPTLTHGKEVGFIFAWISWLSYVVMTPIEIQAILQYSSHFFPSLVTNFQGTIKLTSWGYFIAFALMSFVVFLNTMGVKFLAECNKYASIIKFFIPTLAIFSLTWYAPSFSNLHISLTHAEDWASIFSALSLGGVAFAFTGFQNGLVLAGEVKNPQRNIPIAILGAVLIGFLIYFLLQFSFIVAIPKQYLQGGWQHLSFPGDNGPLVGLSLLLGLSTLAFLLLFDASFSPFGTTLVYTAATSRILYGMALQEHLPAFLTRLNRFKIPHWTLLINFAVGMLSFLPFPGWQKMVAFLSSASILSYGVGPICLLALRQLKPNAKRPFRLKGALVISHLAFYSCNLMLYWCGFAILWKLYLAIFIGLFINLIYRKRHLFFYDQSLQWFLCYMTALLILSYLGSFGGIQFIKFPFDLIVLLPFSIHMLYFSQRCLTKEMNWEVIDQLEMR